jgi:hypothetical protein
MPGEVMYVTTRATVTKQLSHVCLVYLLSVTYINLKNFVLRQVTTRNRHAPLMKFKWQKADLCGEASLRF